MDKVIVQFKKWKGYIRLGSYSNGWTAMTLCDFSGHRVIAKCTVNLSDDPPVDTSDVIIKNYSENEGMDKALVAAGVIELTGEIFNNEFIACPRARIIDINRFI